MATGIPGRDQGFTLIGLLGVLALVGIIAMVTHLNFGSASGSYAIRSEARVIHAELANARARALAEGREYALILTGGTRLHLAVRDGAGWRRTTPPVELAPHVEARVNGASTGEMVFRPLGRVDRPYTVVVTGYDRQVVLQILASGLTRWSQ